MPVKSPFQALCRGLAIALLFYIIAGSQVARAHGGVVIDTGFTPHFEWLVSINPYPVTTGEATITLLVFDATTYGPVNDLRVMLYSTQPGAPQSAPGERSDGVNLTIDPAIYPGDYSANIPLDQAGEWRLQFVVEGDEKSFEMTFPVEVAAVSQAQASSAGGTPDVAATATVFAQNVQLARQQNSPLPVLVSPLTLSKPAETTAAVMRSLISAKLFGISYWLWGIIALIPIIMGWLLLRSSPQTTSDEIPDEIETSDDDDLRPPDVALKDGDA